MNATAQNSPATNRRRVALLRTTEQRRGVGHPVRPALGADDARRLAAEIRRGR